MLVSELEKRTGASRHALRYYEREGLLMDIGRSANNYRLYPESAVRQVNLLRQLQPLGFSLAEIRNILQSIHDDQMDCEHGARLVAEKRNKVKGQIKQLQSVCRMLKKEQKRLEDSAAQQRASAGLINSKVAPEAG